LLSGRISLASLEIHNCGSKDGLNHDSIQIDSSSEQLKGSVQNCLSPQKTSPQLAVVDTSWPLWGDTSYWLVTTVTTGSNLFFVFSSTPWIICGPPLKNVSLN